jgi:hypothetical protein
MRFGSVAGAVIGVLLVPGLALAQIPQPVDPFASVAPGLSVTVTDASGHQTKGKVLRIDGETLTLERSNVSGGVWTEPIDLHRVVTIKKRDSAIEGTLIGIGLGVAATYGFSKHSCHDDPECEGSVIGHFGLPIVGGLAVLGGLADLEEQRTLYKAAPERSAVTIAPIVGRRVGGALLSWRF